MAQRPKDIGTEAESAVAAYLRGQGFQAVERRALSGQHDRGDIAGVPDTVIEVKGGHTAEKASDLRVQQWLLDTEREREAAYARWGVLVMKRAGYGPKRASEWWAVMDGPQFADFLSSDCIDLMEGAVRVHLSTMVRLLKVVVASGGTRE